MKTISFCLILVLGGCGHGGSAVPCPTHAEVEFGSIQKLDAREYFGTVPTLSRLPELAPTRELLNAAADAVEHHRHLAKHEEIFLGRIFHDQERRLVYITFDRTRSELSMLPDGTRPFIPDFFLAYVYDPKAKRLVGYVPMSLA